MRKRANCHDYACATDEEHNDDDDDWNKVVSAKETEAAAALRDKTIMWASERETTTKGAIKPKMKTGFGMKELRTEKGGWMKRGVIKPKWLPTINSMFLDRQWQWERERELGARI